MKKKLRVFHGLVNYGTQAGLFARELRRRGIDSISVIQPDSSQRIADTHLLRSAPFPKRLIPRIINSLRKLYYFFRYNTFHFYFGNTLFARQLDLPFYKLFGKKVIFEYLGNDIRHYKSLVERYNLPENHRFYIHMNSHDEKTQKRVDHEKGHIDYLISCLPTHVEFAKNYDIQVQEVLPLAINCEEIEYTPLPQIHNDQALKILHAPTSRIFKGTEYIVSAIESLQSDGYQIDFKIVEGVTHQQLMYEYKWCDLYIDQISVGWYGTASIEAMAVGRPVCAYIDNVYFKYIEYENEIPVISITKEGITDQLKQVLDNKSTLHKIGASSRKFVEKYHDVKNVTEQLIEIYQKVWESEEVKV